MSKLDYQAVATDTDTNTPSELRRKHRIWRKFPWIGILCLATAFFCGVAALVIGIVSDGRFAEDWAVNGTLVQLSVVFSILVTVANALLGFAFAEGAVITWWVKASRGTTLRELHTSYEQGSGFLRTLFTLPAVSRLTVASFGMLLLLTDGPFFQRASTIHAQAVFASAELNVSVPPFPLQFGATGVIPDHGSDYAPDLYTPSFAQILQQYKTRQPIQLNETGCKGTCSTEITGPGWDVSCSDRATPYKLMSVDDNQEFSTLSRQNASDQYHGPAPIQTMFDTSIVYNYTYVDLNVTRCFNESCWRLQGYSHTIQIGAMFKTNPGLEGTLAWRNCTLSEALVRYPVQLENNTLTIQPRNREVNRTEHLIYRYQEGEGQSNKPSTNGGLWLALNTQFATSAYLTRVGGWFRLTNANPNANEYLRVVNSSGTNMASEFIWWDDPVDDAIFALDQITLRTAIAQAGKPSPFYSDAVHATTQRSGGDISVVYPNVTLMDQTLSQPATARTSTSRLVYRTNYGWLSGGFAVVALACLAILPTFYGWWTVEAKLTMNPLEIAKAFDAPPLRQLDALNGDHANMKLQLRSGTFHQDVERR
ncbi:hypothetical protein PRZ48_011077 [Zasmidium cellare]|uniref:Uncharacterized protein n=1 Tax=Zasmidium cellare TaxID=395010 RepID=A0ABR0EAR3_ZASCE|nr:hypothetical protein PRZ48_011077 [Zasmidium cellare]